MINTRGEVALGRGCPVSTGMPELAVQFVNGERESTESS